MLSRRGYAGRTRLGQALVEHTDLAVRDRINQAKRNGACAQQMVRGVHERLQRPARDNGAMTIVKINAITVPEGSGDELARRFAARAGAVDGRDGFEGFELLRPADERTTWLVVTRWRDEEAFQAWVASPSFAHGHRSAAEREGRPAPAPVAGHSELWSYVPAGGSVPAGS